MTIKFNMKHFLDGKVLVGVAKRMPSYLFSSRDDINKAMEVYVVRRKSYAAQITGAPAYEKYLEKADRKVVKHLGGERVVQLMMIDRVLGM